MRETVITAFMRGHPVTYDGRVWRYVDDGSTADYERPCVSCGLLAAPGGPDPCVGVLPAVKSACCGHGVQEPYVVNAGRVLGPRDWVAAMGRGDG